MPPWLDGTIVTVVVATGGGILTYLIKIERSLGTMIAMQQAQSKDIDELQNWRLNTEHAKALVVPRFRRDII